MPNTIVRQTVLKARRLIRRRQRTVQITISVTPIGDDATLQEVSSLVLDLLSESCSCADSDTFKDVRLINACEEFPPVQGE